MMNEEVRHITLEELKSMPHGRPLRLLPHTHIRQTSLSLIKDHFGSDKVFFDREKTVMRENASVTNTFIKVYSEKKKEGSLNAYVFSLDRLALYKRNKEDFERIIKI